MLRPLALCALVALSACDSSTDLEPYAGVIEVSLVAQLDGGTPGLRLVAVNDIRCQNPLAVVTRETPESLRIRVDGIIRPTRGAECDAVNPAQALIPLPLRGEGEFPIEVTHAGSTDAYTYTAATISLSAVRTSTTRLAAAGAP